MPRFPAEEPLRGFRRHRGPVQGRDRRPAQKSGMFWTVRGANAIIALRYCGVTAKFEPAGRTGRLIYNFHVAHPIQFTRNQVHRFGRR